MDRWTGLLFASCSLAGLIMVVGSLYLLWKGRIALNSETSAPIEFVLPGGFTLKSPVAALIMFALGVFLLVVPIHYNPRLCPDLSFHLKKPLEMVELRGKVSTDMNIEVYAIVDEQPASAEQMVSLSVPYLADRRYVVRYTDKTGALLNEENFRLEAGKPVYELRGVQVKGTVAAASPTPAITLEQTEPSSTVAEFKSQ